MVLSVRAYSLFEQEAFPRHISGITNNLISFKIIIKIKFPREYNVLREIIKLSQYSV
jgi:hypothetical protein